MPYVEWHDTIRNHYKTDALMLALKVKRREAVGIVGCLSSWAIQYRPGGLIERHLIKVAVEWDGDEKELIEALLKAGWVDKKDGERVAIHDWKDITRGYRKARADAARRKRDSSATDALAERGESAVAAPIRTERSELNGTSGADQTSCTGAAAPGNGMAHAQDEDRKKHIKAAYEKAELLKEPESKIKFQEFIGYLENNPEIPGRRIHEIAGKVYAIRESYIFDNGIPTDRLWRYAIEETIKHNASQPSYLGRVMSNAVVKWREGALKD